MARERIKKDERATAKGGTGYRAVRWRDSWTFVCTAKRCDTSASDRDVIERHVAAIHGKAPDGAEPSEILAGGES